MSLTNVSDYKTYRGKCKELCDKAIKEDSTLTLVRGHYYCPIWNSNEPHWWCITQDNIIYDPSKNQFPSKGSGLYTPFDGIVECSECKKSMKEEEVHRFESNYAFCSYECYGIFIGML